MLLLLRRWYLPSLPSPARQSLLLQQFCKIFTSTLNSLQKFYKQVFEIPQILSIFASFSPNCFLFGIFIIFLSFAKSLPPTLILLQNSHKQFPRFYLFFLLSHIVIYNCFLLYILFHPNFVFCISPNKI